MNQARYAQLIEGFCKECGLEEPERILHGGPVAVGDVVFSLIYSEQVNADMIFIYCDFGEVPRDREADAYRVLLEANMFLYTGSGPSFTVSSETGRVVLAEHHRIDGLDPKALREILVKMSEQAMAWRLDHFLEKAPAKSQPRNATQSRNPDARRTSTKGLLRT
jgi:hypothetical protein